LRWVSVHQPPDLAPGAPGHPQIGLAHGDALFPGQPVQPLDRPQEQVAVGRMRDGFRLRGGVDGHPAHLRRLHRARLLGRSQGLGDQRLELLGPDTAAPHRHRGPIERQLRLEIGLAAEILEVGVLQPLPAHLLVRKPARVLDQMQRHHQSRRQPGSPLLGVERPERLVEAPPVDQPRQPHELVAHVDQVVEPVAEQLALALGRARNRVGAHASLLSIREAITAPAPMKEPPRPRRRNRRLFRRSSANPGNLEYARSAQCPRNPLRSRFFADD